MRCAHSMPPMAVAALVSAPRGQSCRAYEGGDITPRAGAVIASARVLTHRFADGSHVELGAMRVPGARLHAQLHRRG
jgi:hypothetical protein